MKNLLLVLVLVSFFSCKKEIIEPSKGIEVIEYNKGYKVYTFNITQYSTNNPEIQELENDFNSLTWDRSSIGMYSCLSNSEFKLGKVFVISNGINYEVAGEDRISLKTYNENNNPSDSKLFNHPFEIRVYD